MNCSKDPLRKSGWVLPQEQRSVRTMRLTKTGTELETPLVAEASTLANPCSLLFVTFRTPPLLREQH